MSRALIALAAVLITLTVAGVAVPFQPAPEAEEKHVLDVLVGRTVGVKEVGDRYSILVDARWQLDAMYKVVDVEDEIVVLENMNRTIRLFVPISSIREITLSKTGVRG